MIELLVFIQWFNLSFSVQTATRIVNLSSNKREEKK